MFDKIAPRACGMTATVGCHSRERGVLPQFGQNRPLEWPLDNHSARGSIMPSPRRYLAICLTAGLTLAVANTPALADPEGDSPPEYIYLGYSDFDPDAVIAVCEEKYDKAPFDTASQVRGMNDRFICLEKAILEAWRDLFDETTRQNQRMEAKLGEMIRLYANIYSVMAQENAGCQLSCGTMWIGHGIGKGVGILEDILRSTHYFLKKYPPRAENPEFIEWRKAGSPPWPPQPDNR